MNRPFNKTFVYIRRLADHVSFGTIAAKCGKETGTAEAWGREPESNVNPNGTGKRNPFDCVLRLIGMAHKEDAGLAREMAEMFHQYIDYLDGKDGLQLSKMPAINELLAKSAKEHMDVMLAILKTPNPNWAQVIQECKQSEAALNTVHGFAVAKLQNGENQ